jgi:hypothetical protein
MSSSPHSFYCIAILATASATATITAVIITAVVRIAIVED